MSSTPQSLAPTKTRKRSASQDTQQQKMIEALLGEQNHQLKTGQRIGTPGQITEPNYLTDTAFMIRQQEHRYVFSPLTIALCGADETFKNNFIHAFIHRSGPKNSNPDPSNREKNAFATAFLQIQYLDQDALNQIERYQDKATSREKKNFLTVLLTASRNKTEANANLVFEAGTQPQLFENGGKLKFWWKLINAIFCGKDHRLSTTFTLATSFLKMPEALRSIKTNASISPLENA